jgi:WD40 repeat protein
LVATGRAGRPKRLFLRLALLILLLLLSWAGWRWFSTAAYRPRAVLAGHRDVIESVAFSPDGETLASAGADQVVLLWDVRTRQVRRTIQGYTTDICAVAFSPDGHTLATASDADEVTEVNAFGGHDTRGAGPGGSKVKLCDALSGEVRQELFGHTYGVQSLAFSRDGKHLATADAGGTIKVWDTATWHERATLSRGGLGIQGVAFSPDGRLLAAGDLGGEVSLWDWSRSQVRWASCAHGGQVRSVAFSPAGDCLASGSQDGTVKLWNARTGKVLATLSASDGACAVAFSPDGSKLAVGTYRGGYDPRPKRDQLFGDVTLWDVATRQVRRSYRGHWEGVLALTFAPDGKTLATGDGGGAVRLWDVPGE